MRFQLYIFLLAAVFQLCNSLECNDGDLYHDGYCYFIPIFPTSAGMQRLDAENYCRQKGFHLPSFHSYEQEEFTVQMAIKIFGKGYNWIGFNHPGGWEDGSVVNYTNWGEGMPRNDHTCVMQYFNYQRNNDAVWRDDYSCSDHAKFFCQYPSRYVPPPVTVPNVPTTTSTTRRPTTTTTTTAPPTSLSCISSDIFINGRCYNFNTAHVSYPTALAGCLSTGKTLSVFDNSAQINAITSYAYQKFGAAAGRFWIGLHQGLNDPQYYWPGHVPMTFSNWAPGYPVAGKVAVTQLLTTGKWENVDELLTLPYVCSGVV